MLKELTIQNFALIKQLHIHFSGGLNVLTGETGAGKSIIIDAVGLLLGERASQSYIRHGADQALVSGLFDVSRLPAAVELLEEMGLPVDQEAELLLARAISATGKNTCRVNGQAITLTMYQRLGNVLVDIHGQHDHQSLLSGATQRHLLDGFCGAEMSKLLSETKETYQQWQATRQRLTELKQRTTQLAREQDFLRFQLAEIDKAALKDGEEEQLDQEKRRLEGAETLASGSEKVRSVLYSGTGGNNAYDAVSTALAELNAMVKYDPELEQITVTLEQVTYQLEEAAALMRSYSEGLSFEPDRINQVESRLQLIQQLERKYGNSIQQVLIYRDQAAASLAELTAQEENQETLERQESELQQSYQIIADKVTAMRQAGGEALCHRLSDLWQDLAMAATRFQVEVSACPATPYGKDSIQFLISPNPGEELKSLSKIASGGEMSRVMLALKTVLAEVDQVPTLIFDEIDAGIGGKVIAKVADKLAAVAQNRQVLCVTHSARIAAQSETHLAISKQVVNDRTITCVNSLTGQQRVEELARMLGGTDKVSMEHARVLLQNA